MENNGRVGDCDSDHDGRDLWARIRWTRGPRRFTLSDMLMQTLFASMSFWAATAGSSNSVAQHSVLVSQNVRSAAGRCGQVRHGWAGYKACSFNEKAGSEVTDMADVNTQSCDECGDL